MTLADQPDHHRQSATRRHSPEAVRGSQPTSRELLVGSTERDAPGGPDPTTVDSMASEVDPSFVTMLEMLRGEIAADDVFVNPVIDDATGEGPRRIGRFEILRQLGQGGYGVVFLAHDPQLNRQVALKVPRPEVLVTASLRQRFLREAEAAAALSHAHVVPVYEAGHIGPLCYIASAYYAGANLDQWLTQQTSPIAPTDAAAYVQKLAEAMQHAHLRGVLHRDLKPSNVLMSPAEAVSDDSETEASWIPRVTDFGLARLAEATAKQTQSNAILGTPSYMAPEQAAGKVDLISTATDIYGLGAILYFLLTGRPPFEAETPVATLQAVVAGEPVRATRLRPDIPRDLEAVCLKCLEKSPAKRYRHACDLAADLQRLLDGEPVQARAPVLGSGCCGGLVVGRHWPP